MRRTLRLNKKTKERNKIQTQKKRQPPIRDCFEILFLKFREKKQQQQKKNIYFRKVFRKRKTRERQRLIKKKI